MAEPLARHPAIVARAMNRTHSKLFSPDLLGFWFHLAFLGLLSSYWHSFHLASMWHLSSLCQPSLSLP
jgi:hypothetical protein